MLGTTPTCRGKDGPSSTELNGISHSGKDKVKDGETESVGQLSDLTQAQDICCGAGAILPQQEANIFHQWQGTLIHPGTALWGRRFTVPVCR